MMLNLCVCICVCQCVCDCEWRLGCGRKAWLWNSWTWWAMHALMGLFVLVRWFRAAAAYFWCSELDVICTKCLHGFTNGICFLLHAAVSARSDHPCQRGTFAFWNNVLKVRMCEFISGIGWKQDMQWNTPASKHACSQRLLASVQIQASNLFDVVYITLRGPEYPHSSRGTATCTNALYRHTKTRLEAFM